MGASPPRETAWRLLRQGPRLEQILLACLASSLRLRAAWLYHAHGLTQKDVAEQLGLGRSTVVRLLDEAVRRGEVRIWIEEGEAELAGLAVALERRLGLDEAIVVPARGGGTEQVIRSVGLALGKFLSESVRDGMAKASSAS